MVRRNKDREESVAEKGSKGTVFDVGERTEALRAKSISPLQRLIDTEGRWGLTERLSCWRVELHGTEAPCGSCMSFRAFSSTSSQETHQYSTLNTLGPLLYSTDRHLVY